MVNRHLTAQREQIAVETDLSSFGPERFSSRELSRLEFGARLLDLGEDQTLPMLERCKFVAIFADMIDEFFQVRVVSLEDKVAAGVQTPSVDGMRPRQQLEAIRERVLELIERQDRLMLDSMLPEPSPTVASRSCATTTSTSEAKDSLARYFDENVYPVLTPLAVDPGHPFPMISNLSLNIAVTVRDEVTEDERSARVKVPNSLPRFLPAGPERVVPVRGPHHRAPRPTLSGHDHRSCRPLSRDTQRGPHVGRGRGRRPARRPRGGAASPTLRRGVARGDPARHVRGVLEAARRPVRPRSFERLRDRRHARPERPVEPVPASTDRT